MCLTPGASDGEPFRRRGMAEEEHVHEAWRLEVAEIASGETGMCAVERIWLLGQVERGAVRGPLGAALEPGAGRQRDELKREEQQKRLGQRPRVRDPRAEH